MSKGRKGLIIQVLVLKTPKNYILSVPCQAGLLFAIRRTVRKKRMAAANRQKKHFLSNDPLKNFAFGIFCFRRILEAKFYNGLHRKY